MLGVDIVSERPQRTRRQERNVAALTAMQYAPDRSRDKEDSSPAPLQAPARLHEVVACTECQQPRVSASWFDKSLSPKSPNGAPQALGS